MSRKERLEKRNESVRKFFAELEKKHPQWKLSALIEETANHFQPLSGATVSAILKGHGIYKKSVSE